MKTLLIVLTLAEVAILVVVLALYLIVIAATLRKISKTLGLVTFGVRAIEKQTEPIGPVAADINESLEQVAAALESVVNPAGAEPAATVSGEAEKRRGKD
ncbi:MAG TPA: DUF948 domain-containing protein [Solirubrobacterales bacterium]|nr:DUF948 domain-containing protein [Solirubrobacterales bacterium]